MPQQRFFASPGTRVYGLAAMFLGVVGLIWGDFASTWQPVPATVPHRAILAYLYAAFLLLAGAAVEWRASMRAGALALVVLYCIPASFWLRRVLVAPRMIGTWGGYGEEEVALICAGILVFAMASGSSKGAVVVARVCCSVFALCFLALGLEHFMALSAAAAFVPKWIPPGQRFWVVFTGICHILAALAIFFQVLDLLASRLLTAMIAVFGLLIWLPWVIAQPHVHLMWGGNGVNLALMGAAWVVADSIALRKRQREDAVGRVAETGAKARA